VRTRCPPSPPAKRVRTRSPGLALGLSFSALRGRFSREIIDPASRRRCGRQHQASWTKALREGDQSSPDHHRATGERRNVGLWYCKGAKCASHPDRHHEVRVPGGSAPTGLGRRAERTSAFCIPKKSPSKKARAFGCGAARGGRGGVRRPHVKTIRYPGCCSEFSERIFLIGSLSTNAGSSVEIADQDDGKRGHHARDSE
jgi:hypothetical protein